MCVTWQQDKHPLHTLCINKGRDSYFALNEKRYFALATDMFRKYVTGNVSIQDLERDYFSCEERVQSFYNDVTNTDLTKLSDVELQDHTHTLNKFYIELVQTIYIETIDYDKILSVIGQDKKGELDGIWERATESTFLSFEARQLGKLLAILASGEGDPIRKTEFVYTDYSRMKNRDEIAKELDAIREHLIEKTAEFEKSKAAVQDKRAAYAAWITTLDPEMRKVAEYMQLVMHFRDLRKDPIAQVLAIDSEVATEMFKRADIDPQYISFVLLYEYMRGVEHLKSIKADIAMRASGCIYIANPDLTYDVEHCDFEMAVAEFEGWAKHEHDSDELKGQIACCGFVRGTVRVVSDPHDDKGFQDGDILVTSMTRPEFVPIMKRAGAVVTNEGGITCHAAIVSRELKIPCIIGTKIATQVLHDGDMVEVDADNGVVRILEKGSGVEK